jgi:hypothetical protein
MIMNVVSLSVQVVSGESCAVSATALTIACAAYLALVCSPSTGPHVVVLLLAS